MITICTEDDIFNYAAMQECEDDERHYESLPRCMHCELPLSDDGECREERCYSHFYDDHGCAREWVSQ